MSRFLITIFLLFFLLGSSKAQQSIEKKVHLYFFSKCPFPNGHFIEGIMTLSSDSLVFKPTRLTDIISDVKISCQDIKGVINKNSLLIFPNRFKLQLVDGRDYEFYSFKRKEILKEICK
jgi:hypothetical protein